MVARHKGVTSSLSVSCNEQLSADSANCSEPPIARKNAEVRKPVGMCVEQDFNLRLRLVGCGGTVYNLDTGVNDSD